MYWTPLFWVAALRWVGEAPLGGRECGKGREVVSGRLVGWGLRWWGFDRPMVRFLGCDFAWIVVGELEVMSLFFLC
jgi:hypothetical protein